ncbi:unnamed protein product [Rhizophagus irregularis]|nr:unnamed protein product [Rhizophagus irregularis]
MSAILCGKRHDEKLLTIKSIHNNSGIPYTRCDKSEVKRQQIQLNRKATRSNKKSETKNTHKRKAASIISVQDNQNTSEMMAEMISNRNNEVQVENLESSSINPINKGNESVLSIELEERKLALLERQVKLRKETAEAEAIELKNQQLKMSMSL